MADRQDMAGQAGPPRTGQVAAVVLAGGGASRLGGADKPGIKVGGRTLLAAVAAAAAGAGARYLVVVGPARPDLDGLAETLPGAPTIVFTAERPSGAGPVPALRAGLSLVAEDWLLQVAVAAAAGQPPPWLDCDTAEDVAAARAHARDGTQRTEADDELAGEVDRRGLR